MGKPVTKDRVLARLGQLAECIEGGQDAHSLLPGIGVIEREVACLGADARVKALEKALAASKDLCAIHEAEVKRLHAGIAEFLAKEER